LGEADASSVTWNYGFPVGHGNMWAALIYQHASEGADRQIADALAQRLAEEGSTGLASAIQH
jgi:hypothetical protein